jgi:Geranylgeranyl pyrophosphate synthase
LTEELDLSLLQAQIEKELKTCIDASPDPRYREYEAMFSYQMDWEPDFAGARGKRVRPMLLLLTTHAVGGDWNQALPAAASLELMHNFSLIHDDIQDQSPTRRGKATMWVKWGIPLAINAGDAMLSLSTLAMQRLNADYPAPVVNRVSTLAQKACRALTRGQFLDISFESQSETSLNDYWEMIGGKTCSLLAAALEIGAILGGAAERQRASLYTCGYSLGQAYQVQDDWLGIWGDDALLGKSTQSDLLARKKSYPILLGLEKKKQFYALWQKLEKIEAQSIPALVEALEADGVKEETEAQMEKLYQQTLNAFSAAACAPARSDALFSLLKKLTNRSQ